MTSVKLMMEEHQNILRMVKVVRKVCFQVLLGTAIDYDDFYEIIEFIKNYADFHHHGKEEEIMFKFMKNELGRMGDNLITHGMLVEHDQGRLYMQELREALERVKGGDEVSKLDVIANAISYTHLIERHIKKEDELIYPFGENNLSEESLLKIEEETLGFEAQALEKGIPKFYLTILNKLESKYNV